MIPGCVLIPTLVYDDIERIGKVPTGRWEPVQVTDSLKDESDGDLVFISLWRLDVDGEVFVGSGYKVSAFKISSPHCQLVLSGDGQTHLDTAGADVTAVNSIRVEVSSSNHEVTATDEACFKSPVSLDIENPHEGDKVLSNEWD